MLSFCAVRRAESESPKLFFVVHDINFSYYRVHDHRTPHVAQTRIQRTGSQPLPAGRHQSAACRGLRRVAANHRQLDRQHSGVRQGRARGARRCQCPGGTQSLQRAIGFQHTVKRTVLHLDQERTITNTVQFPPDTRACIFWLRNRCPENWDVRPARLPHDGADHSEALLAELDAAGERARASRQGD
jgi:hypothetical protein